MIWHCGQYDFDTSTPLIMGILNVTPDSFSDGGAYLDPEAAVEHGLDMVRAGAAIVDVGGESTRPGATPVTPEEEWNRIGDVVAALVEAGICVSVDTRHAEVATRALHAGASIVNDVSGFRDPAMVEAVRRCGCGCVVMHMKGEPATMQNDPVYEDVVAEVRDYLRDAAAALEAAGVDRSRICVDPGPGFGKTPKQTIELMRNLHEIVHLGYPVMVAVSRKRFVGEAYQVEELHDRDVASAAEALLACELGASVVRTHNVEMTVAAGGAPGWLADYIAQNLAVDVSAKQEILDELNVTRRLAMVIRLLGEETEILKIENEIQDELKTQIDKNQKEYYLREQMNVISEELGDAEDTRAEADTYREKVKALNLDEEST